MGLDLARSTPSGPQICPLSSTLTIGVLVGCLCVVQFSLSRESENHGCRQVKSEMSFVDLKVKVIPLAKENRVVGYQDDVLKVKVTAPPVEGKANKAVVKLLARALGTKKGNVEIIRGSKSREKLIRITGVDTRALRNLL